MDWTDIGKRIRKQRERMGYTREQFSELLDVTPKFCSDIELGVKGMSVSTLCKISEVLRLSTDYILFGENIAKQHEGKYLIDCFTERERVYAEEILRVFLMAMNMKKDEEKKDA